MPDRINNLVVLGAGSDIGRALCRAAGQRDSVNVLAVSFRSPPAPEAGLQVKRLDGVDLTRRHDLEALARNVGDTFKEPFAVVHSVGNFWNHKPLLDTDWEEMGGMLNSHVLTLFGTARFLTPFMKKNGGGRLVAFSCNSVTYNYPDMAPFTASKAAIESFIKSYANEHAPFGITACALALPTVRTQKVLREKPDGDHANYITPETLAEVVLDNVINLPGCVNGNVIKLFQPSPTFYHRSYYDRNPLRPALEQAP